MCIASKGAMIMPLSAQDVCFNSNFDGCGGGMIDTPWTFIKRHGVVTGGQYQGTGPFGKGYCADFSLPHCHHHGPQVCLPRVTRSPFTTPATCHPSAVHNTCHVSP